MKRRWGGKLGGNHQTVIDAAWRLIPAMVRESSITKISPGFISAGKPARGRISVKIIECHGFLLLSIRGSSAHQEIRVFSFDFNKAKMAIVSAAGAAQFSVSYGVRP